MTIDVQGALSSATIVDSGHPAVIAFAQRVCPGASAAAVTDEHSARERAVKLYYAVRDEVRYDPYRVDLTVNGLKASRVLADGYGWCVSKAALLAAACRVVGVPARVGFADVRNHMSTERLREHMGTDMFYYHGYTAILLGGQWLKATPAFNIELCTRMRMLPLEFDGTADSIYHPFSADGARHMEYVALRGEFDDVPHADLMRTFAQHYPNWDALRNADWDGDVHAQLRPA